MKTDKSSLPCPDKKQMVANQKVPFICYMCAFKIYFTFNPINSQHGLNNLVFLITSRQNKGEINDEFLLILCQISG